MKQFLSIFVVGNSVKMKTFALLNTYEFRNGGFKKTQKMFKRLRMLLKIYLIYAILQMTCRISYLNSFFRLRCTTV